MSCVIADKNQIISIGYNKCKTNPNSTHKYKMIHCEFDAIKKVKNLKNLKNCDIFIYREHKNGAMANSFPCSTCLEMIKKVGIKYIYFTNKNTVEKFKT